MAAVGRRAVRSAARCQLPGRDPAADEYDDAGRGSERSTREDVTPAPPPRQVGDAAVLARLADDCCPQRLPCRWLCRGLGVVGDRPELCRDEVEVFDVRGALCAVLEMADETRLVLGSQTVQGVAGCQLVPFAVAGHGSTDPSTSTAPPRMSRNFRIAARVRLLTVPSGTPVNPAISLWV